MNRSLLALVVAAASVASLPAHAGSAAANFDVLITHAPVCQIWDGTAPVTTIGNLSMTYTNFGAAVTGSTSFNVRCSTGLPFGLSLDAATVTDGLTGLDYKLALKTANIGNASTAVGSLPGQTGVATGTQFFVQGYIPAGQAGIATPGIDNKTRTLTVAY